MTGRTLALTTAIALLAGPARAERWRIDPDRSVARFSVRHMMVENVTGEFSRVTGSIDLDPKDPSRSRIEAAIDARTVNTKDEERDRHLRSEDFFDVVRFPEIRFSATKIRRLAEDRFAVSGNLTIHGVTLPVELDVRTAPEAREGAGRRSAATATTVLHRKDYGILWNQVLDAGGVAVGDDVTVTLSIEARAS